MMDNNALCWVMTKYDFPNKKYSKDHTTPKNSKSITLYFSSLELRNRYAHATVCQPVGDRCSNAAPKPALEASHLTRVSKCGLSPVLSVAFATLFFMRWKCVSCSLFQMNWVFFLRSGRSGWHNWESLGMNLPNTERILKMNVVVLNF